MTTDILSLRSIWINIWRHLLTKNVLRCLRLWNFQKLINNNNNGNSHLQVISSTISFRQFSMLWPWSYVYMQNFLKSAVRNRYANNFACNTTKSKNKMWKPSIFIPDSCRNNWIYRFDCLTHVIILIC